MGASLLFYSLLFKRGGRRVVRNNNIPVENIRKTIFFTGIFLYWERGRPIPILRYRNTKYITGIIPTLRYTSV